MKQLLQNLRDGTTSVEEAPNLCVTSGHLLIESSVSLISAGTERMLVDFAKANIIEKARQQPEKVRMILTKVHTDGLISAVGAVQAKLQQPIPLGYSSVGIVSALGSGVSGFNIGDRVMSNGHHASMVLVPSNLCARIPDNVKNESAAFTVLAAIGLQGIRLAQPTLGDSVVVIGTGVIGLLTIQLLHAQGCRVMAIDPDDSRLSLAEQFGANICNPGIGEDPVAAGIAFSKGNGVDAVIITASTKSSDPVQQAAQMSRQRGRIVLVGVTGLELNRADFYKKELTFQVSCSYGPGRYDPEYEEKGKDYPIGYVRWTEQRNFEAVLNLMAVGKIDLEPLITHSFAFDDAPKAYDALSNDKSTLGILLHYDQIKGDRDRSSRVRLSGNRTSNPARPIVGFIGAGNYASRSLVPAFSDAEAILHTIASLRGMNATLLGKKAGFAYSASDATEVLENSEINTVVISTQHDSHAHYVTEALRHAKHVFVEKPLCLTIEQLEEIKKDFQNSNTLLTVGFNRRFAPQVIKVKQLLGSDATPISMVMTVNAGAIPGDHWVHDKEKGGGRIIGEACHFIDLLRFLAGQRISSFNISTMESQSGDSASIQLQFSNGSIGTVHYFANGSRSFPKERLEVFSGGRVLLLDNFRKLKGYGWPGFSNMNLWRQDKGQKAMVAAFVDAVEKGGPPPIPVEEIFEVSRVCLELVGQYVAD